MKFKTIIKPIGNKSICILIPKAQKDLAGFSIGDIVEVDITKIITTDSASESISSI